MRFAEVKHVDGWHWAQLDGKRVVLMHPRAFKTKADAAKARRKFTHSLPKPQRSEHRIEDALHRRRGTEPKGIL